MSIHRRSSVNDIQTIETRGPWTTKSRANLNVLFALPERTVEAFLDYGNPEFNRVQQKTGANIRGLRAYNVSGIPEGSIGGMEWHVARTELVTALGGSALWQCEDLDGRQVEFVLDGQTSVLQPPGILHTYTALKEDTHLQVVCNTLFDPNDPRTQDTYSMQMFQELQHGD